MDDVPADLLSLLGVLCRVFCKCTVIAQKQVGGMGSMLHQNVQQNQMWLFACLIHSCQIFTDF